jgi:Sulfotransferase domain
MFRAYGTMTARGRIPPDFLIVGTKRGGTTSLLKYLQRHPGVLPLWPAVQNMKKTWYFDDSYRRSMRWYLSFFETRRHTDRCAARLGYRPVTGEAAPYYMYHPLVPQRVAASLPSVRIIMLLRNPVDRAYSHWSERRQAGQEPLGFADAIESERTRLDGQADLLRTGSLARSDTHDFYSYVDRGDYLPQVRRWQRHLPADRLLIVRSEDLYFRPVNILQKVHEFLGIPTIAPSDVLHYNKLNREPVDDSTRTLLTTHFRPRVAALEAHLGRQFEWELSAPSNLLGDLDHGH